MHEFYEQENIDILMVGASHCFRGIDPSIISENTEKNVFLASSSRQNPDASFAILKEAVKLYDVEQIYLEMSVTIALETGQYKEREDLTRTYLISDYMRPSLNKVSFLLGASSSKYYVNGFWIAKRTELQDFSWNAIAELHDRKSTDIYKNYEYDYTARETQWYTGNGHVEVDEQIARSAYFTDKVDTLSVDTDKISEDWCNTILDIIDYCEKKDVKLVLYAAPVSDFQLAAEGNYDDYIGYVRSLIDKKGVEYVDFNLLSEDYFPYLSTNYSDNDHLNMYGARAFSEVLSDYINGKLPENAFCESVSEKLENAKPEYYGIAYLDDENKRNIRLISNHPEAFEYKVRQIYDDKAPMIIQNFSTNSELSIPFGLFDGQLAVTYRQVGSDEEVEIIY